MGFKCGIVGLPNVGKSTIFNALTNAGAEAANFPFCTKEPNVGMVDVPDARLKHLAEIYKPKKVTPAVMQFVDIAGLVKGASQGEGLGNQFLSHIRETEAIMQVVRCFDDIDVTHVAGSVDPVRDCEIINTELILRDMDTIEKRLSKDKKLAAGPGKDAKELKIKVEAMEKLMQAFNQDLPARSVSFTEEELKSIQEFALLTLKPMFYVANVREEEIHTGNSHIEALKAMAHKENSEVLTISGKIESELGELPEEERESFLKELGLGESGLDQVIRKGFSVLGLETYFTAGEKEVRSWVIPKGFKAPQAAGVIHTDFERGFIRAETLAYKDFVNCGSWNSAKEKGLVRTEGKEYFVQDGDIMLFLFNV